LAILSLVFFNIIEDKRIRKLFLKGPEYRSPSKIDFNACCSHIAESIEDFSIKWRRRENADSEIGHKMGAI
jgi:hypothetical protein